MRFRSFDSLKIFCTVAETMSFTGTGKILHMSKGAVSYQVAKLEGELGFQLFERDHTQISLTPRGTSLWKAAKHHFGQLDKVIFELRDDTADKLCVGAHSWFISRWLGSRLADFAQDHPDTELRVEPINTTADLKNPILDLSVFWCSEDEGKRLGSQLYVSRTIPLANPKIAKRAGEMGIVNILNEVPLLPDASGMEGWKLWHKLAGINYAPRHKPLHLPDANSRLQAVISGDGVALLDDLARPEIDAGFLIPISQVALDGYGYYVIRGPNKSMSETTKRFEKWLKKQSFKC